MKILLSIKPEYSQKILSGEKKYEFRKKIPSLGITKVYIYESEPTKKIVGWFTIKKIISGKPEQIWDRYHEHGGVEKEFYNSYCNGNSIIHALEVNRTHKYSEPINPYLSNDRFFPPQSYYYIDDKFISINNLI